MSKKYFPSLHPAVCLLYFIAVLGITLACIHPVMTTISLASAVVFSWQLNGGEKVWQTARYVLPMVLLISIANPLFNHRGVTLLFTLWGHWITLEAAVYGIVSAMSLAAVIYWFSCWQTVMTSDKVLYLFGKAAPNTALLVTMTLGLIPRLQTRSRQIAEAQQMLYPDTDRVLPRMQRAVRSLSSLMTWSMESSLRTADSMKARGYGVRRRTTFHLFFFDSRDAFILGLIIALGLTCVLARCFGHGTMEYYPRMSAVVTGGSGFMLYGLFTLLALFPSVLELKEAAKWRYCSLKM